MLAETMSSPFPKDTYILPVQAWAHEPGQLNLSRSVGVSNDSSSDRTASGKRTKLDLDFAG
jgi:hypothetical protein